MEIEPRIEKLLSVLGYKDKEDFRYYPLEKFSSLSSLSHLSRIVLRINQEDQNGSDNSEQRVYGAYIIETNAAEQDITKFRPVVFVAKANDLDEAREIHRRLWLSASAPFIIVLLPDQIKASPYFLDCSTP